MQQRLAAFLRGVNVGGNRKMEMATLRRVLEAAGMADVRTLLQSGNVVFGEECTDMRIIAERVERTIEAEFGFAPRVFIRTLHQLEQAVADDPLTSVATDPARHFFGFLLDAPAKAAVAAAAAESVGDDLVRVVGSHVYLWCPNGIGRSPLSRVNFEKILGSPVTLRNENTVRKVADLLRS